MNNENEPKEIIGYGNPPKHTRFKAGQSGNPKGRPRKVKAFYDHVEAELRTPIEVTENGKSRKISKAQAIAKMHIRKALGGDVKSTQLLLNGSSKGTDEPDNLGAMLEAFRERNRQRVLDNRKNNIPSLDTANDEP